MGRGRSAGRWATSRGSCRLRSLLRFSPTPSCQRRARRGTLTAMSQPPRPPLIRPSGARPARGSSAPASSASVRRGGGAERGARGGSGSGPLAPRLRHSLRRFAVIWVLAALCLLPELVLSGADRGLWGSARWRPLAYGYGAFWAGLLHGWRPNFALQPVTMFFSYGWLHGGPGHLLGNMVTLAWLGPLVLARQGVVRFLVLWGAGMAGGAAMFGLLASSPAPMVGASGALFGLMGELTLWEMRSAPTRGLALRRGLAMAVLLAALNALVWISEGGRLAWEAHLGGFLAGFALIALWRARR